MRFKKAHFSSLSRSLWIISHNCVVSPGKLLANADVSIGSIVVSYLFGL